ncbi:MAG: fused MFS/spermidine synthase [Planctomycetota bacterium]|nr:fused MFS/spermidine synthase [Planctomycetota bacterium]
MSKKQSLDSERSGDISPRLVYAMVFFSGFAGLVYQILWMKQLGVLFGNTSHAAAATLAAFFAGVAGGSWFWGMRSTTTDNPLRVYAWLEAGIALTALLYFVVLSLFYLIYPAVYQSVGNGVALLGIKLLLALVLVFPPAFCMGGTIPVIGQFLIRTEGQFGITAALLYGVNTLGAALGAFLTGFCFVLLLGLKMTCVGAMVITGLVAATAYRLSGRSGYPVAEDEKNQETPTMPTRAKEKRKKKRAKEVTRQPGNSVDRIALHFICFLSGFGVLALEVLWTRMFAQVHENSIYSFSSVLVIVLVCLALGALMASMLARLAFPPLPLLACLMILSGLAVSVSPFIFMYLTDDFQMLDASGSFQHYTVQLFLKGFASIGLPTLLLGTVFPFLMKIEERFAIQPGRVLGRLSAVNTVGAILGSVVCGFVLLGQLGMWRTMQLISAMYLVAGILLPTAWDKRGLFIKAVGGGFILLAVTGLSPTGLPVTGRDPARLAEEVLEAWETSDCTVSVVENMVGHRAIRINSNYRLGSTDAAPQQEFQGRMPLLIYPGTKSVFFLGMGTGITAGASLDEPFRSVERVVACEMVPEVVTAARRYMAGELPAKAVARSEYDMAWMPDLTNGLFKDPRAEVLIEDGRHYLMATNETFNMINADLFLPYRSGAGSLYSREHFKSARARLNPGGVFVQWLPLYQMTENEFGIVARTMLAVFEQVTLWRHNFQPGAEIIALFGHRDASPLPASIIDSSAEKRASVTGRSYLDLHHLMLPLNEQTILLFYCGNLTAAADLFARYPINTDDRPIIEYTTPRTLRQKSGDLPPTFVGPRLATLVDKLLTRCPPELDPMLAKRTVENRRLPVAGAAFHQAWIEQAVGDTKKCREAWNRFVREWTNQGGDPGPRN